MSETAPDSQTCEIQASSTPATGATPVGDSDDDFNEIEQRVRELSNQYPNAQESVQLHARLRRYKQDPAYELRYRKTMSILMRSGFKTGHRHY